MGFVVYRASSVAISVDSGKALDNGGVTEQSVNLILIVHWRS